MAVAEVGGDGIIVIAPHPDPALWRLPVVFGSTEEVEAKVKRWAKLDPDGTRRVPGWRQGGSGRGISSVDAWNLEALARFRDLCADQPSQPRRPGQAGKADFQRRRNEMTDITPAGFIFQDRDGYAIFGTGATEDEAWSEVLEYTDGFRDPATGETIPAEAARETQFVSHPATAALIEKVKDEGGAIAWSFRDGIACTVSEEDGED